MISVVIPVRNEERSVALLVDELVSALQPLGLEWETIFVAFITLKDGRRVINVGATPDGSIVVVEFDRRDRALSARLLELPPG